MPAKFHFNLLSLVAAVVVCSPILAQEDEIAEAVAVAEAVADDSAASASKSSVRPLTVAAGLFDDTVITGTLMDSTAIEIQTAFGQASIPLAEVAGIRFPGGDDVSTTVMMLNGDSITGATDLKFASIETSWGSAKITGQNISTLLFVPGLRWESTESIGGARWQLIEATAAPSGGQTSGVQSASANQPVRVPPRSVPMTGRPLGQPLGQPIRP